MKAFAANSGGVVTEELWLLQAVQVWWVRPPDGSTAQMCHRLPLPSLISKKQRLFNVFAPPQNFLLTYCLLGTVQEVAHLLVISSMIELGCL